MALGALPPGREIDTPTRDGAAGAGHPPAVRWPITPSRAPVHGGLNLLFLVSGIAFAELCFGGRDRSVLALQGHRVSPRPLAVWSVVFCMFWFAVFGRFRPPPSFFHGQQLVHDRTGVENSRSGTRRSCCRCCWASWPFSRCRACCSGSAARPSHGAAGRGLRGRLALAGGAAQVGRVDTITLPTASASATPETSCWAGCSWAVLHARDASGVDRAVLNRLLRAADAGHVPRARRSREPRCASGSRIPGERSC